MNAKQTRLALQTARWTPALQRTPQQQQLLAQALAKTAARAALKSLTK